MLENVAPEFVPRALRPVGFSIVFVQAMHLAGYANGVDTIANN